MKIKSIPVLILIGLLVAVSIPATNAQSQPLPTIVTFTSSVNSISVADAETNAATTTLSWDVIGLTNDYQLTLHYTVLDGWEPVFAPQGVPLEASGSRLATIKHTLTFAPPTFLLSIVQRSSNKIVEQRTLSIPYTEMAAPDVTIEEFAFDATGFDQPEIIESITRLDVSWEVLNRPPTANLVFEQVYASGDTQSVEFPRLNLWVPSVARGSVGPLMLEENVAVATVRLSVVDVLSGEVYAEEELEIDPADLYADYVPATTPDTSPDEADTDTDTDTSPDEADTATGDDSAAEPVERVLSFTASPATAQPGGSVTLVWDAGDPDATGAVTITQAVPNVTASPVVAQVDALSGSAVVELPDYAAYTVQFTLVTDDGQLAEVEVAISCPYTYFFGAGDGCPAASATTVGAVYQEFERGVMLWRSDTNEIYVHFNDGTARYFTAAAYAGLPEPALTTMPPLDRQAPTAGFGKVWANIAGLQDQLGWALGDEVGYNATIQGVALTRDPRPTWAFYFTLPDGSVVGSGFGLWRAVS